MNRSTTTQLADGGTTTESGTGAASRQGASGGVAARVLDTVGRADRWLAAGLGVLAAALAANTVLGPLIADVIEYPFSESLVSQTIGLEAVTLVVVVPWCLAAAAFVLRGHRAGPLLAIPPTAYTVYMFVQYVLGPQYVEYTPVVAFHLGIFALGWALLALAWARTAPSSLPTLGRRRVRLTALGLLALAAFTATRYVDALGGMATGGPLPAEYAADPTMYWSIVLLDLGVIVPIAVATAVGLLRGASWARAAAYGVVGWFVLVPLSVAAMAVVMLANGDPNTTVGSVAVFAVVAGLFTLFAGWVYRPLFGSSTDGR